MLFGGRSPQPLKTALAGLAGGGKVHITNPITSCCFFRQYRLHFFCQMFTELMGKDGGVKPVEAHVAPFDHVDQRIEHLRFIAGLIAKAEMMLSLDEA